MDKIFRIKELTKELNVYRNEYYNNQNSIICDQKYDEMYDELVKLEDEMMFSLSNSPTKSVGYDVKSKLQKVTHNHPMLSLDKTKNLDDIKNLISGKQAVLMLKLDGLTISLEYIDGELVKAETRGNGVEGELITDNVKMFKNVPLKINHKGRLVVDGEAIITYNDFDIINSKLTDNEKYKNPRNLASGSVRQLDNNITKERNVRFIAWKLVESENKSNEFIDNLELLEDLGFDVVERIFISEDRLSQLDVDYLKDLAKINKQPIDGLVITYNDIKYGESLGSTGHHPRHSIAYKFYDEEIETTLIEVEWSPSRTGQLNPVAIFEPVEIEGTTVSRASLHNLSIIEDLKLGIGDIITVYKANMIIPQISENLSKSNTLDIPSHCPVCGSFTSIKQLDESKVLVCTNPNCESKLIGRLTHFSSKNAMNIDGFSESTIEKFVELKWLESLLDIYKLNIYKSEMIKLDGFGIKSVEKLLSSIEKSKNVKFENFIYALGIPLIGRTASKTIGKYCNGDVDNFTRLINNYFDFNELEDFGSFRNKSLHLYFENDSNSLMFTDLVDMLTFENMKEIDSDNSNKLNDLTFVITGSLNTFSNRDELKNKIELLGGKVSGSVSSKSDYLINNDNTSNSSKNKKAKELSVKIITEEQFLEIINN